MVISCQHAPPECSHRCKCHLEKLCGHSHSFLPKPWMGVRNMRDCPALMDLGISVWRQVRHKLDAASQLCPPNSVNILTCVGRFGGKIRAHRDNAPNMATDPTHNSQILGTSVMAVSFFDRQMLEFFPLQTGSKCCRNFCLDHCSICTLHSLDDVRWKHSARFPKVGEAGHNANNSIRVGMACRWLGRRCLGFGSDCGTVRRFMEVWENPDEHVRRHFPNCAEGRSNFKMKKGQPANHSV